ncbi:hypothetical protein [Mucilaginibacter myungsuensis]|uniref:Uncharacterized protein n=1 Tax=Mucilaginibacter myungsuensis TaxID=649104 RepID=A0A929KT52_9SPHI|nr:hypothetical protein [Mucilaginibacter myungsuensis]MBE9661076.1 hypothetical protein [Mucilaginibacter myungsuensis]MDN3597220.1 hypothetical protein [Mucilaginibacter myungsuensis]
MPLIKSSKILVVSSATSLVPVPAKKHVIHVDSADKIFPAIHQHQPDSIILDHDHLLADTEKVLRRLSSNKFYSKIRIVCHKRTEQPKVDDLLKTLGVDKFIYADEVKLKAEQPKRDLKALAEELEAKVVGVFAKPSF